MFSTTKNIIINRKEVNALNYAISTLGHIEVSANNILIVGDYYYNHILIRELTVSNFATKRNLRNILRDIIMVCNQNNRVCEYICINSSISDCSLSVKQLKKLGFANTYPWVTELYGLKMLAWRAHD